MTEQELVQRCQPAIEQLGLELLQIAIRRGRTSKIIVVIDTPQFSRSITIDECADVSRAIDPLLEDLDFPFHLEVTSCGEERPLRTFAQLSWCVGKELVLHTKPRQKVLLLSTNTAQQTFTFRPVSPKSVKAPPVEDIPTQELAWGACAVHEQRKFDFSKGGTVHEL